jgi:hypothetical protein
METTLIVAIVIGGIVAATAVLIALRDEWKKD